MRERWVETAFPLLAESQAPGGRGWGPERGRARDEDGEFRGLPEPSSHTVQEFGPWKRKARGDQPLSPSTLILAWLHVVREDVPRV